MLVRRSISAIAFGKQAEDIRFRKPPVTIRYLSILLTVPKVSGLLWTMSVTESAGDSADRRARNLASISARLRPSSDVFQKSLPGGDFQRVVTLVCRGIVITGA